MKKEKIFMILLDCLFNFLGYLEMTFKDFFKILAIITFMILIFKTFSYLNLRLEKWQEIEKEKLFNMSDIEKIKIDGNIKIANIEQNKLILKVCLDYKELTDFVNCVKTLNK